MSKFVSCRFLNNHKDRCLVGLIKGVEGTNFSFLLLFITIQSFILQWKPLIIVIKIRTLMVQELIMFVKVDRTFCKTVLCWRN